MKRYLILITILLSTSIAFAQLDDDGKSYSTSRNKSTTTTLIEKPLFIQLTGKTYIHYLDMVSAPMTAGFRWYPNMDKFLEVLT